VGVFTSVLGGIVGHLVNQHPLVVGLGCSLGAIFGGYCGFNECQRACNARRFSFSVIPSRFYTT
jgi:hypothetical protein